MAVASITVHNYSRHIVYDMPPVLMEYRQRVFTHYHFPKHHHHIHCIVVSLLYILLCYYAHIWFIMCTHYESYMRVITCWVAWTHIAALVQETAWRCRTGDKLLHEPNILHWRHNGHNSVSNHQPHDCLFSRLFPSRSKETSKLRVTGLCAGNSPHKWPATRKMFPFDDVIMFMTRHMYAYIHTPIHYDQIWFYIIRYDIWYDMI